MDAEEQSRRNAYILRETLVSAAINGVISALFFFAVFGTGAPVPVSEQGFAADFLPQSGAVTLMACVVPGMIARRAQKTGRPGTGNSNPVTARRLVRAAVTSILIGLALGAVIALALLASDLAAQSWLTALVIKIFYGAALGAWTTWRVLHRLIGGTPPIRKTS